MADAEAITVKELRGFLLESEEPLFDSIVARALRERERQERYEAERDRSEAR